MGISHQKSIKVIPGIRLDNGKGVPMRPSGATIRIPSTGNGNTANTPRIESAPTSRTKKRSPKATAKIFGFALVMLSLIAVAGLFYKNKTAPAMSTAAPPTVQAPAEPLPEVTAEPEEVAIVEPLAPPALVEAPPEPPPVPFTKDTPLPARIVLQDTVVVISQVMGGVGIGKGQTVEVIRRNGSYLVVRKDESVFAVEAASVTGYLTR